MLLSALGLQDCFRFGDHHRSGLFLQNNVISQQAQTLLLRLQVNEFHHAPIDFIFTSPLNDSVLPPLRVSGDGVLKEFGFVPGRGLMDAAMVWLLLACFGMLTYFFLETAGRQVSRELLVGWFMIE